MIIGGAIHNIAGDILTTAEGGEEIGEVIADTFMGAQRSLNVEVLDEGVVVVVVLTVMNDPTVNCLYLLGIGFTVGANFVSKFFRLCVPQGRTTVSEIGCFRFADEIVCSDYRDQNESCNCNDINFRHQPFLTRSICRGNEIHQFGDE